MEKFKLFIMLCFSMLIFFFNPAQAIEKDIIDSNQDLNNHKYVLEAKMFENCRQVCRQVYFCKNYQML